jgi:UDP-GlcNAc:undecaprenyl-phosphate/decaprenyl-phosphate GlcNAc-1-phosphate transferase
MLILNCLILIVMAFGVSLLLTPVVRDLALRMGAVDKPGARKIHVIAVPRLGGISIVVAVVLAILATQALGRMPGLMPGRETWVILMGGIIVFLIGVCDDLRPLPVSIRFLFQGIAAAIAIWFDIRFEYLSAFGGGTFDLGIFAIPITFLWIVGLTNAFNLIDGLDGLAAGLGLIAASTTAAIFVIAGGVPDSLLLLLVLSGALAGFLCYNFHPATIFLGDSGSQFIGYVLGVTAIIGSQKGGTSLPIIIPFLVFGLPILDTVLSMVRRALRGPRSTHQRQSSLRKQILVAKRMFTADRDHVHHRMLAMGFSHRSAVLALYGFAAALSCLALISVVAQYRNSGAILLIVIAAMYVGVRKLGYEEIVFLRTRVLRWCEQTMFTRTSFQAVLDSLLTVAAYWAAFLLKYDGAWTPYAAKWYLIAFPFVLLIQMSVFFSLGLYRGIWRAIGIADLLRLSFATGIALLLSYVVTVIWGSPAGTVGFFGIDGLLLLVLLVGGRSAHRILIHLRRRDSATEGPSIIIYGAGRRGQSILQELMENRGLSLHPIGFLDDDPSLRGFTINRVRILGASHDLSSILNCHKISALIISSHKISAERLIPVMTLCSEQRVPILRGEFQLDRLSILRRSGAHDASDEKQQIAEKPGKTYAPGYSRKVKATPIR